MTPMLKHTMKLLSEKTAWQRLLICSIGLSVSCCAGLKKFPTDTLIEYDHKNKVCGKYKIVDAENFKFDYLGDIPCPDVFGFTSKDTPNVLNWLQDAKEYARNHCR